MSPGQLQQQTITPSSNSASHDTYDPKILTEERDAYTSPWMFVEEALVPFRGSSCRTSHDQCLKHEARGFMSWPVRDYSDRTKLRRPYTSWRSQLNHPMPQLRDYDEALTSGLAQNRPGPRGRALFGVVGCVGASTYGTRSRLRSLKRL